MRVVLDTNVLISAFVFPGGAPEDVVRAALEGRIQMVTSPALLAEFARVLAAKFGWDDAHVEAAVALVVRNAELVRPSTPVRVVREDPPDDRVLEAAAEGRADAIVSGDRHLRRLGAWEGIAVRGPADLAATLATRPEGNP